MIRRLNNSFRVQSSEDYAARYICKCQQMEFVFVKHVEYDRAVNMASALKEVKGQTTVMTCVIDLSHSLSFTCRQYSRSTYWVCLKTTLHSEHKMLNITHTYFTINFCRHQRLFP